MNFPPQDPGPFTRPGIEWLNPNQRGCYGIFSASRCIYIGQGDLRDRLLAHLSGNGGNPYILLHGPTHYLTVVPNSLLMRLDDMERDLIRTYQPVANRTAGG